MKIAEFRTSLERAKRLRDYLNREYKPPIVLTDSSSFDWREFIMVPCDVELRKKFIVSYELNIHKTTPDNLIQSFRDKDYSVSILLNTIPIRTFVDMSIEVFLERAGLKLDLSVFE